MSVNLLSKEVVACRLCGSNRLSPALVLQPIPISTQNIGKQVRTAVKNFDQILIPNTLNRCLSCGNLQLSHHADTETLYRDFQYETKISVGLRAHFCEMAEKIWKYCKLSKGSKVFEIGSNDGTILEIFQKKGATVLGIDPAKKIAKAATQNGTETIGDFFTAKVAKDILKKHGRFDLIFSANTVANIPDLTDVLAGADLLLNDGGTMIIETQYAADVVKKNLLDVIYHEHITYFLVKPTQSFLAANDFCLVDFDLIAPKGGSIRFYIQKKKFHGQISPKVGKQIAWEKKAGFYQFSIFKAYQEKIDLISAKVLKLAQDAKKANRKVVVYGASIGCKALIHQFQLATLLDYIIDDQPILKKMSGPGYSIPVKSADELLKDRDALVIILAWRYIKNIFKQHGKLLSARSGITITPLPSLKRLP